MSPLQFFCRKYQQGWTDGDLIVLLTLAEAPNYTATLSEIARSTEMAVASVHHALQTLTTRKLLEVRAKSQAKRSIKHYTITKEGEAALVAFLKEPSSRNIPKS